VANNPYRGLPDYQFWSRAVTWQAPGHLDPMIENHQIQAHERIVTLGSCFAQHLARNLAGLGLNYHVVEKAPDMMTLEDARAYNYGVFSARNGNVYTVRQALQLLERAFGLFSPKDDVWKTEAGFVDAFRPTIDPRPYPDCDSVRISAREHLAFVRKMFIDADWIVFTLGLTEAWQSCEDGAVYPIAPGVAAGSYDPSAYRFVNFSIAEVQQDLCKFIDLLASLNPACRIILTVSPVPLIATYDRQHVLTATTYSKSVLRVAAGEAARRYRNVVYFPSYEIILSDQMYYEDDLREVKAIGVKHVMRVFRKHFVAMDELPIGSLDQRASSDPVKSGYATAAPYDENVICDENIIEASLANSRTGMPSSD
jgi:hypothetical protein